MNKLLTNEVLDKGSFSSDRNDLKIFDNDNQIPLEQLSDPNVESENEQKKNLTTINLHIHCKAETSDDLLRICGDSGVWQVMIYFLASLCGFNCAIQNFIFTFIADPPDHYCSLPIDDEYSDKDLKEMLIPKDESGSFEKCYQYRYAMNDGVIKVDRTHREFCNKTKHYEQLYFGETIASNWDLVCENSFWLSSVQAAYMFGVLVGSVVFGIISDKFGRKTTIWISSFLFFICAHLVALSPNFVALLTFRFLLGCASPGVYSASYVLVVEVTASKRRGLAGSLYSLPFSIGYMILPVIAYFIRDWRNLQFVCSCLTPLLLLTAWYLPESPRWLLTQGRSAESEKIFRAIAEMNGKTDELPKHFSELVANVAAEVKETVKKTCVERLRDYISALFRLIKTPRIRFRIITMSISFAAISLIYYGIAIDATNLGFDKYLFTFLCGLFEIPADLMTPFLIGRIGRRITFAGMLLLCGTSLLISLLLPTGSTITIILAILAQLLIAADSSLCYLYCSELFPTVLRNYSLGISSMVGRTGSIAAPYIVELLGENHKNYPTIIFGASALVAGTLALFLPETKNKKLPETVKEVEEN